MSIAVFVWITSCFQGNVLIFNSMIFFEYV